MGSALFLNKVLRQGISVPHKGKGQKMWHGASGG